MLFKFLRKTEKFQKKEANRAEVFSKIAEAKRNGRTSVHIEDKILLELSNELNVMGYSVYSTSGFSGTNIYWKN